MSVTPDDLQHTANGSIWLIHACVDDTSMFWFSNLMAMGSLAAEGVHVDAKTSDAINEDGVEYVCNDVKWAHQAFWGKTENFLSVWCLVCYAEICNNSPVNGDNLFNTWKHINPWCDYDKICLNPFLVLPLLQMSCSCKVKKMIQLLWTNNLALCEGYYFLTLNFFWYMICLKVITVTPIHNNDICVCVHVCV